MHDEEFKSLWAQFLEKFRIKYVLSIDRYFDLTHLFNRPLAINYLTLSFAALGAVSKKSGTLR